MKRIEKDLSWALHIMLQGRWQRRQEDSVKGRYTLLPNEVFDQRSEEKLKLPALLKQAQKDYIT